ncbi:MAG: ClpB protein, partial [Cyanobacteriota bacterium]
EAVRRRPYSVVLLDEVEKAHMDVFNILLQVLDDGRITDSQGRVVDFRNTIIVMTSNIGSDHILNMTGGEADYEKMRGQVLQALRKHFRPEFLNRIDDLIIFHTLNREELGHIVRLQLKRLENLLAEQKLSLVLTDTALEHIVAAGYDPVYGARPLKRAIQRELENPIATKILENTFAEEDTIVIDCVDSQLIFSKQVAPTTEADPATAPATNTAIAVEDDSP